MTIASMRGKPKPQVNSASIAAPPTARLAASPILGRILLVAEALQSSRVVEGAGLGEVAVPGHRRSAAKRRTRLMGVAAWLLEHRLVLSLTVTAAVLRFAFLGAQSFWYDESLTVGEVRLPVGSMLALVDRQETSPPLYFVLAWGWARMFGSAELGLRTLSAVCGTIAVPLSYGAAAALVNRRAAGLSAALVATSPMLIWYSQEARPYALLVALSALSLWCMREPARAPTDAGWWDGRSAPRPH